MLKREYEILKPFVERPWLKFTFRQIKALYGKKSKGYAYDALKRFSKQGILLEQKAGNVVLYSLNLTSLKTQVFTGFVAEYIGWSRKNLPHDDISHLSSKVPAGFFTLTITGSYVKGKQKTGSDLDVVIICDDCAEPKKVYAELKHYCEMNIPPIHLYVFRRKEFLQMLLDKKANYGKEIARSNIILCGGREYYSMICEAMEHGFNG
jgi:predicted nucleotidyltransferase